MSPLVGPWIAGMLAPVLVVLPVAATGEWAGTGAADPPVVTAGDLELAPVSEASTLHGDPEFSTFRAMAAAQRKAEVANQVRIEQRLIMRVAPSIAPRPPLRDPRRNFFADFPERRAPHFNERKMAQCLPVAGIAGVQPDGSRLILYMRDQRIVSATLEKSCNARDYYSGFLVERSGDGMICAGRDKLLSRSGANCGLNKLHQLIEVEDE